jgi:hypothetical protein
MRRLLFICLCVSSVLMAKAQNTYYTDASTVDNDVTDLSIWSDDPSGDGSGTPPPDFTSGDIFVITAGGLAIANSLWTVSGPNSKVVIENGCELDANGFDHTLTLDVQAGGAYFIRSVYNNLTLGTISPTGIIVIDNNSNLTLRNLNYGTLILTGTGGTFSFGTLPTTSVSISGNLNIQGSKTVRMVFNATSKTMSISGNLVVSGSAIFNISTGTGTALVNVLGNVDLSSGTLNLSTGSGSTTVNVGGNYIQSGTSVFRGINGIGAVAPTLNISGDYSLIGTGCVFRGVEGTSPAIPIINLNGTGTRLLNIGSAPTNSNYELRFNGTGTTFNLQSIYGSSDALARNLTLQAGTLTLGANDLRITGNVQGSGGQLTATTGRLFLQGTTTELLNGVLSIPNLTINNAAGATVSSAASDSLMISRLLNMVSGAITTNGKLVLIGNGGINDVSSVNPQGSVIGNVRIFRQGNTFVGPPIVWNHVASPVRSADVDFTALQFGGYIGRLYNEVNTSTNLNTGWTNVTSGNLTTARGYATARPGTIMYFGQVNNGGQVIAVSRTPSGLPASDGWNLIGNPYPSGISHLIFLAANSGLFEGEAVHVFNTSTRNYLTRNTLSSNFTIPSGQGFFVKALDSTSLTPVIFDNIMRNTTNSALLKIKTIQRKLNLQFVGPDSVIDETLIVSSTSASDGFDKLLDASKLWGSGNVQLASMIGNNDYMAIQAVAPVSSSKIVPLMYNAVTPGQHRFISPDMTDFDSIDIVLEDTQLNLMHNFKTSGDYVFSQQATVYGSTRFRLHFLPTLVAGLASTTTSTPEPYLFTLRPKVLLLDMAGVERKGAVIKVLDLQGREHKVVEVTNEETKIELPLQQLSSGAYIVTLQDATGVYTFKTILE